MRRLVAARYGRLCLRRRRARVKFAWSEGAEDRLCERPDQAVRRRVAVTLLGVVVLSACSGSSQPSSSPPTSSTPTANATPTPDASVAAGEAALAAYRGFRRAQVAAEAVANARSPGLAKYAGDKALAQERANLLQLARAGIVVTGQPVLAPHVIAVALGGPPMVTIKDCIDTSSWKPIYKSTGKSAAAPDQPSRVLATALARPYGKSWIIAELTTDRSRSC